MENGLMLNQINMCRLSISMEYYCEHCKNDNGWFQQAHQCKECLKDFIIIKKEKIMSNWIDNRLILIGNNNDIAEVRNNIKGDESILSDVMLHHYKNKKGVDRIPAIELNKIKPIPECFGFDNDGIRRVASKIIPNNTGYDDWISWCRSEWGTDREAWDTPNDYDADDIICFITAWHPPLAAIGSLSIQYPMIGLPSSILLLYV